MIPRARPRPARRSCASPPPVGRDGPRWWPRETGRSGRSAARGRRLTAAPQQQEDRRQIFAMGGGGFTMDPANPLLDDFVLSLPGTAEPKILFLATASGETSAHLNAFRDRFA